MNKIIRTPSKAHGGITSVEKEKMDQHAKLWIARAMRTEPINREKITLSIQALYKAANLPLPRVIIVPSPIVMATAGTFAARIIATRNATVIATVNATDNATYNATVNATVIATDSATDDATRNATYSATYNATVIATVNATYNATVIATDNATDNATRNATVIATVDNNWAFNVALRFFKSPKDAVTALNLTKEWQTHYQGGNMWASYVCYLTAARDILGLQLAEHQAYKSWEDCAIEGGFRYMHKDFCMVCDFPEILTKDDQNRPHGENGPSHRWRDGWSLYHWHGVVVPEEWIMDKASLTPEVALSWQNIEQRRAACEILGWSKILTQLNAKVIDSNEDNEIGELVECNLPDAGVSRFLRVMCGTGREFALPVPPTVATALEASAWTYGLEDDFMNYIPEVRT